MIKFIILALLLTLNTSFAHAAELLYFYDKFCGACQKFDEEVGSIYPKTHEAETLPIKKIEFSVWRKQKRAPYQDTLNKKVIGTPTFVVIDNGVEIDRLVGYSNDELFWLSIASMRNKLD
jgi:thiol-disulfide isomerase/thioredoxin